MWSQTTTASRAATTLWISRPSAHKRRPRKRFSQVANKTEGFPQLLHLVHRPKEEDRNKERVIGHADLAQFFLVLVTCPQALLEFFVLVENLLVEVLVKPLHPCDAR